LVQDCGEKVSRCMKNKTKYRKAPKAVADAILHSEIVEDFLPPPDKLVFKEQTVKVTLALSQRSIEFFKAKAREYNVPYQAMIKRIVDLYAQRHGE
jgi:predicted DNA binding CopG/RHH family protein